jgi:hypothetical protein
MYSELETMVLKTIKNEYGNQWEKVDESIVSEKIESAKLLYQMATDEFYDNQSAKNYNLCITAMISLQYWNQKRVRLFSLVEDF